MKTKIYPVTDTRPGHASTRPDGDLSVRRFCADRAPCSPPGLRSPRWPGSGRSPDQCASLRRRLGLGQERSTKPMLCLTARYRNDMVSLPASAGEARLCAGLENDFVLPFPGVLRPHARISLENSDVAIRDTRSGNGLNVDGRRVEEVRLKRGASVQIGHAFLILDEAPTSELEVGPGLAPDLGRPQESRPTGVGVDSYRKSLAAGVRLNRDADRPGSKGPLSQPKEIVGRLHTLLGADAVVPAEFVKGDVSIIGGAGQLPADQSFSGLNTVEPSKAALPPVSPDPKEELVLRLGGCRKARPFPGGRQRATVLSRMDVLELITNAADLCNHWRL